MIRYVIRILKAANGTPTFADGKYVKEYDPQFHHDSRYDGGVLRVTSNINEAFMFSSPVEAIKKWREETNCECHRLRPDGQPNRPLTAYSVEIRMVSVSRLSR